FRIEGYGDIKPVDSNDTAEGRARNRRVEVTLLYDETLVKPQPAEAGPAVDTPPASVEEAAAVSVFGPVQAEASSPMESLLINPCPGCDTGEK
ncbi:MAG TPA: hypothetical protein VM011_01445, partial [Gammaproteobacteria bacterium]|nr:hypothetical protein [Gammaproteobacteria bacterium]